MKKLNQSKPTLFLYLIIFYQSNFAFAQSLESKIDNLIQTELKDINGPGGVFMVSKNGKAIYQKAFGKL